MFLKILHKKAWGTWTGVAFVLAITFRLRGQVTVPVITARTVSLSAAYIRTLGTLSDAQFGEWLDVLAATPTIAAEDLPQRGMVGNFYSLAHPNWPPLPADIWRIPIWNLSSDSGSGFYLLDDLDYPESFATGGMMAMDAPNPPGFIGGGTNGGGGYSSNLQPQVFTTNDLWLQLVGTTNTGTALTAQLVIHTPWNVTNGVYGLYFKTNLAVPYNWTWLLRNVSGQTNLTVTNLPPTQGFFMLGAPTAIRSGFTNNILADTYEHGTDDGSTGLVPIGFPINFFGTSYTNLYVNNNGNVTFDTYLKAYTPEPLLDLGKNIIAPFWADVDTRSTNSGVTTYGTNTVDGRAAFGINWIDVGYFSFEYDKLDSFQMILIDRSDRTNGDFDLEFNYSQIQWEAGDYTIIYSGGSDGLWVGPVGSPARVGYASASGSTNSTFELNGSGIARSFLNTNTVTGLIDTNFNSTVPGRYVFQFHNGEPLGTP
jgi:hypothetical protein